MIIYFISYEYGSDLLMRFEFVSNMPAPQFRGQIFVSARIRVVQG
jgi:hypothetical protein